MSMPKKFHTHCDKKNIFYDATTTSRELLICNLPTYFKTFPNFIPPFLTLNMNVIVNTPVDIILHRKLSICMRKEKGNPMTLETGVCLEATLSP